MPDQDRRQHIPLELILSIVYALWGLFETFTRSKFLGGALVGIAAGLQLGKLIRYVVRKMEDRP